MEVPVFAEKLGTGKWVGIRYILDVCPICSGKETMMFTGKGMWGCSKCKKGGPDTESLRQYFAKDPMLSEYVQSIVDPERPEGLIVVSEYHSPYKAHAIGTGFGKIDYLLGGLSEGAMTIITGRRGEGKSTYMGQVALNAIQSNHNVCFYSGELSAGRFQSWLFAQAAGNRNLIPMQDQFGAVRYLVKDDVETKIRTWLGDKLSLYDNTKVKSSERRTILKCFNKARAYYGADLFIVDNLMTARYDIDNERDSLRAQANFASEMMDFARMNNVHMMIVAHPRKGDSGDINEDVSGLGDITNMATNVIQVKKLKDGDKLSKGYDSVITVAKNREHGDTGEFYFNFDKQCKRYIPTEGYCVSKYGWEA